MTRKSYAGGAVETTLTTTLALGATTATLTSATGWPTTTNGPFVAVVNRGVDEEKILVGARSGTSLSSITRGYDGTTDQAHTGTPSIIHCVDASSIEEANAHTNDTSRDDHTQYINTTRHDVTARHAFGAAFASPSAPPSITTAAAAGSAGGPARSDHTHDLAAGVAGAGLGLSGGVLAVNVDSATIEINSDTLRVKAGGIGANEIAATAVSAGTYGDGSHYTTFTVDADGRLTSASQTALPSVATGFEAGDTKWSARTTPSSGWLLGDGSAVSRSTYADLFAAIGTTFGAGNGTTTFNVPDGRGRALIGVGTGSGLTARTLGATVGEEAHLLSSAEMPSHTHTQNSHTHTASTTADDTGTGAGGLQSGVDVIGTPGAVTVNSATAVNQNTGGGGTHNNMQPSLALNLFIKI